MSKLMIAPALSLPLDFVLRSAVIYGAPESGKTTTATVIAEEAWKNGVRFCAIDPKGDWYGVKSTRDGKSGAIPAVVFGGDHADLPLEETAGRFIAGVVATLEQPSVLDLEHLSKGKQIRFVAAFLETLYEKNRNPLLLILDEAQRWAPQKPMSPEHVVCLGAAEDIVKLGRKHGLGRLFVTQRGAGLNKEVAELADVLIAHRTPGVLDQERVQGWLHANVGKTRAGEVMEWLAGLRKGEAVIASAHPEMEMFARVQVRDRTTFDSSQTPAIGQKHAEPKVLAKPDLEAIKAQMSQSIQKQKADDPRELRKRIQELERQLVQSTKHKEQVREVEKVVEVLPRTAHRDIQSAVEDWAEVNHRAAMRALDDVLAKVFERFPAQLKGRTVQPAVGAGARTAETARPLASPRAVPTAAKARPVPSAEVSGVKLGAGERKVLAVLAQWPDGRAQRDVAFLAGYSAKASTLGVILSNLRRAGLVEPGQPVKATPAGLEAAGGVEKLPSGPELLAYWLRHPRIGEGERKVLRVLIEAYPEALTHADLCDRTGYSPAASTMGVILSKLRKLGLVEAGQRRVPDSFMEAIQ